eukprot:6441351-Alexandrium_andersonii.AAC.1
MAAGAQIGHWARAMMWALALLFAASLTCPAAHRLTCHVCLFVCACSRNCRAVVLAFVLVLVRV